MEELRKLTRPLASRRTLECILNASNAVRKEGIPAVPEYADPIWSAIYDLRLAIEPYCIEPTESDT